MHPQHTEEEEELEPYRIVVAATHYTPISKPRKKDGFTTRQWACWYASGTDSTQDITTMSTL